ncbi:MAG: EAL domain-containing protein [Actinomycetes bacterium]
MKQLNSRSLGLLGLICVLGYIATLGRPSSFAFTALVAVASIAAIPLGIVRFKPAHPGAWWLMFIGMLSHAIAGILWATSSVAVYSNGTASFPNLFHVIGYIFLGAGSLLLLGRRRFQEDPAEALDTLIIVTAVGVASWGLILHPLASNIALDGGITALITMYPLIALATVGCSAQLWFASSGTKNASMRLVVAALSTLVIANIFQSAQVLADGQTWGGGYSVALRMPFYFLLGMAALHPSMATTNIASTPNQPTPWWRFALLTTLAGFAPLSVVVSDSLLSRPTEYRGLFIGTFIVFATVILRLSFLGRNLNQTASRARTLNAASNNLVQALTIQQIHKVAHLAVAEILHENQTLVWLINEPTLFTGQNNNSEGEARTLRVLKTTDALPQSLGVSGQSFFGVFLLPTTVAEVTQMAVSSIHTPSRAARTTLMQLADNVAHALDRVRHAELAADNESSERLQRLLHDASDVIAVLDSDLHISYVTPAVSRLIGPTADSLQGSNWLDLVHPQDQSLVERTIRHSHDSRTSRTEVRLVTDSGEERFVEMSATRFEDETGTGFTVSCHDYTRRYELEQQLKHQAFHDALTGLANRSLLQERLRQAIDHSRRTNKDFAVMFIDLDDFKNVNDSLGHAVGDSLLRSVARRLRATLRTIDTPARLGGDEFAVLLEEVDDRLEVERVAARVVDALAQPVRIGGSELLVAASVGVAYGNGSSKDIEDIMRNADLALYEAKGSGKNRYAIFEPQMHEFAVTKMELTADMRRGIARNEFTVHFQPLVNLVNDQIIGVEALARWNHPTKGILAPAHFVSLAEETGLIIPLGREILESALIEAGRWQEMLGSDLLVSVNLSGRQLMDSCIVDDVKFALSVSGVPAQNLVLEITESVLLPGESIMADRLRELAELGVRLYIDDFGTGYSSLSYLRQLPVKGIKLAREFVATLPGQANEQALVRAIYELAQTLNLDEVVAEGIETDEQRQALVDLGFTIGQGYLLARPASAERTNELIALQIQSLLGT